MPKLKPGHISPTPDEEAAIQRGIDADPDTYVPTDEEFARSMIAMHRNSHQRHAYALCRLSLAMDRVIVATSPGQKDQAKRWAAAWGQVAKLNIPPNTTGKAKPETITTRSGRTLILSTPEEDAEIQRGIDADPDTFSPTDEEFAKFRKVDLTKRGRTGHE